MKIFPVVGYENFYKAKFSDEVFSLMKSYPSDVLLIYLIKINSYLNLSTENELVKQTFIFHLHFPYLSEDRKVLIKSTFLELREREQNEESVPIFFSPHGIVNLIKLILGNYTKAEGSEIINEVNVQCDLFDLILYSNEVYFQEKGKMDYDLFSYQAIWKLHLLQQNYIRDTQSIIKVSPIKFFLLEKFIRTKLTNGSSVLEEFSRNIQADNFFSFCILFLNILSEAISAYSRDGEAKWHIELTDQNRKLFETFSTPKPYLLPGKTLDNTHRDIIPKPFYFITNDNAAIIDFQFLGFIIDAGLVYNIYQFSTLNKSILFPRYDDFKSFIGKNFHEEFLCKTILKAIFYKKHQELIGEGEEEGLPDFILQDNTDIFVIEAKSSSVHYNVLESLDIELFKAHLDEKYLQKKEVASRNRGVHQIVTFIEKWEHKNFNQLSGIKKKNSRIFPIIIYSDSALDVAGVNAYCNETFELSISTSRKAFKHIYPLTFININTFIDYYATFRAKPALIKNYIIEYHKKGKDLRKNAFKAKNPKTFFLSNLSFRQYLNTNHIPTELNLETLKLELQLFED